MRKSLLIPAAAVLAAALLTGCSDDEPEALGGGPARVLVVAEEDRSPVAGVKIVVMDGEANVPLAGPAITDEDGLVAFDQLPPGRYPVLAFGGFRHRFFGFNPAQLHVVNPPRGRKGIAPGPTTPPAPETAPVTFLAYPANRDSLPRFRGRVVDAETGDPLPGAFLGLRPFMQGYRALSEPSDDVTGPDGTFRVSGVPVAVDPISGNLAQILPVKVVRHGYRPILFTYQFPNGSDETDVSGLVLELEKVAPADTARVTGRILRGAGPLAGVAVGLGFATPGAKSAAGLTGWGALSGEDGRFVIDGLPAGQYLLHAGYAVGDGVVGPPAPLQVQVGPGGATDVGDVVVRHEIQPIQPYQGALLSAAPDLLIWTAVPGAVAYEVYLDREFVGSFDAPMASLAGTEVLPGLHVWEVGAFAADETLLGFSQVRSWFRVAEGEE